LAFVAGWGIRLSRGGRCWQVTVFASFLVLEMGRSQFIDTGAGLAVFLMYELARGGDGVVDLFLVALARRAFLVCLLTVRFCHT